MYIYIYIYIYKYIYIYIYIYIYAIPLAELLLFFKVFIRSDISLGGVGKV